MSINKIRELTERLAAAESMFESLFEQAPDAYIVTDYEGTIVMVNQQAEEMFGYSRLALVGQRVEVLMPRQFHETHVAERERVCNEAMDSVKRMGNDTVAARRFDGSEFQVQIQHGPLRNNGTAYRASVVREVGRVG